MQERQGWHWLSRTTLAHANEPKWEEGLQSRQTTGQEEVPEEEHSSVQASRPGPRIWLKVLRIELQPGVQLVPAELYPYGPPIQCLQPESLLPRPANAILLAATIVPALPDASTAAVLPAGSAVSALPVSPTCAHIDQLGYIHSTSIPAVTVYSVTL